MNDHAPIGRKIVFGGKFPHCINCTCLNRFSNNQTKFFNLFSKNIILTH